MRRAARPPPHPWPPHCVPHEPPLAAAAAGAAVPCLRATCHCASTAVTPSRRGLCATTQVLRGLLASATTAVFVTRTTSHGIAADSPRSAVATHSMHATAEASMSAAAAALAADATARHGRPEPDSSDTKCCCRPGCRPPLVRDDVRRAARLRCASGTSCRSLPLQQPAVPCAAAPRLRATRHCASMVVAPSRRGLCATTQVLRDLLVSATAVPFARTPHVPALPARAPAAHVRDLRNQVQRPDAVHSRGPDAPDASSAHP